MAGSITPKQIKKTNRQLIYDYIYKNRKVSQQDITYALRLSRPTVASNLTELEEDGLIYKNGQLDSDQIGRKAVAYSITPDYRIAIGVEIMSDVVKIIAIDLYGKKIYRVVLEIPYQNQASYYEKVSRAVLEFIEDLEVSKDKILGIGFSMQGLVSADGGTIVYGKILGCTGLKIDVFSSNLPYPCCFVHDPDAAARSELWSAPELTDAIYLSLSIHLGGSMIINRNIVTGKHGHTATFEHIQARQQGELCYCGRRGCWETLCSMHALLGNEDPTAFFEKVRSGAPEQVKRWHTYLKDLSSLIGMLSLVNDVDFILGGHLAKYFTQADIQFMYDELRRNCPFEDRDDYILISKMPSHNITIGAALPYIYSFLENIGPRTENAPADPVQ